MKPPTAKQLYELLKWCGRGAPGPRGRNREQEEARNRKVSLLFADELRRLGWLAEEGYAPGSWANPERTWT
jgi:hypothetical protein